MFFCGEAFISLLSGISTIEGVIAAPSFAAIASSEVLLLQTFSTLLSGSLAFYVFLLAVAAFASMTGLRLSSSFRLAEFVWVVDLFLFLLAGFMFFGIKALALALAAAVFAACRCR